MKKLLLAGAIVFSLSTAVCADSLDNAQFSAADIVRSGMRALNVAPTAPVGRRSRGMTALQKHVAFFDKDGDGTITVSETELSLRQLGLGPVKARTSAFLIHAFLGPKTSGRFHLSVSVKNIALGKHGSDTGVFDANGDFVPAAFERIFTEFAAVPSDAMSGDEIQAMVAANSKLRPGDSTPAKKEFELLLLIAADRTKNVGGKPVPAISKERLREFYDGSLFYRIAKQPIPRN